MEVDRLVQLVDMLIWVVDPQKYADAALHDRYLIPLATHADVMMVVLNQADQLTPAERDQCLRDLRRLRASLKASTGLASWCRLSPATGWTSCAQARQSGRREESSGAASRPMSAPSGATGERFRHDQGLPVSKQSIDRMNKRLAEAAAVPVVTEAVGKAWRLRGGLATGWPVLAWVAKFKPDPLRRLHLDRSAPAQTRRSTRPRWAAHPAGHLGCAEGPGRHRHPCLG